MRTPELMLVAASAAAALLVGSTGEHVRSSVGVYGDAFDSSATEVLIDLAEGGALADPRSEKTSGGAR